MSEAPSPQAVGYAVGALVRLDGEAAEGELAVAASNFGRVARSELTATLDWLERTLLVEQVGPGRWRLAPDLLEALGGGSRPGHGIAIGTALGPALAELETQNPLGYEIYRRRKLAAAAPPTLSQLGEERGVTRERIRQLEARFEMELMGSIAGNLDSPIYAASQRLAKLLGPLVRPESIPTAVEALGAGRLDEGHVRLLLLLAGPYREYKGWSVRDRFLEASDEVLERAMEGTDAAPLAAVVEGLAGLGVREEDALPWLADCEGFVVTKEHLIRRGRSLADRGVAILALREEPMTLEQIFEELNEEKSFRGFKSQMQGDPRVRRRGLKHYGLEAWGGEEYTSVADEMAQEIERRGEPVDLDELAHTLSERFGISPNSVRMYANGVQFVLDGSGKVSVGVDVAPPDTKPLALTRGCFRLPGGWALRRPVDHDVLRGSGSAIPLGFAKELGLKPGESLQLQSRHGALSCSWPNHTAHVGSLRKVALAHGASEGDYLFIVAEGEGRVDFLHVDAAACEASSGVERLASECGAEEGSTDGVAAALEIEAHASGPLATQIRQRLVQRGEDDLAALVPDEDEGDLLDVLAGL